ncbi:MAG TPA: hypothetical protein VFX79_02955 [Candidatus Saccharimonadales bacterium]|nr:hypothetical protein [Candidatus Saccharimonadales bacterium]
MTRRGFAPIGSRGEWLQFASGKRYPYVLWGGTFREASDRIISDDSSRVKAISVIAIGQIERSEIGLLTFGEGLGPEKTASELHDQAQRLVSGTVETPSWAEEFEEPFEDFKTMSRQENSGLVVVTHGSDTESASFGKNTGPSVSSHALTAMGDMLINEAGLKAPAQAAQQGQPAA